MPPKRLYYYYYTRGCIQKYIFIYLRMHLILRLSIYDYYYVFLIRCFSLLILILITPNTNGHTKEQHYNPFFRYNLLPNPVLLIDVDSKAASD